MDIRGKNLLVIGGAGLIGSRTVVSFVRGCWVGHIHNLPVVGKRTNRRLKDPRVSLYEIGGDI